MRKLIQLTLLLISTIIYAQQGINYKALIRDNAGNTIADQAITVTFTILENTTAVFSETHTPTTDANGLIILNIGEGTLISGDFNTINWASNDHFLNTQIDTGSGLTNMGTTEFMAVPYAKHATTATTALNAATNINELSDGKTSTTAVYLGNGAGFTETSPNRWNVGVGYQALYFNTSGDYNTTNGFRALYFNTSGSYNTANGSEALYSNTTGNSNTAYGTKALYNNTTGNYNTAYGTGALFYNTTGFGNVALGDNAGANEIGSNTLYIDNSSTSTPLIYGEFDNNKLEINGTLQVKEGSDATLSNGSGYFVIGNENAANVVFDTNEIMARNNGNTAPLYFQIDGGDVYVGGSIVHSSDRRLKKDITTLTYGLDEILKLQPKAYYWKSRNQKQKSLGLIAQEVQTIIKEIVLEQDNNQKTLAVDYTALIPVLINAIKEQQVEITNLKNTINTQETSLLQQQNNFKTLLDRIVSLEKENKTTMLTLNN